MSKSTAYTTSPNSRTSHLTEEVKGGEDGRESIFEEDLFGENSLGVGHVAICNLSPRERVSR